MTSGDRIRDRVGAEARATLVVHDQPTGHRGVVTKAHPHRVVTSAAVPGDRQPDRGAAVGPQQVGGNNTELLERSWPSFPIPASSIR